MNVVSGLVPEDKISLDTFPLTFVVRGFSGEDEVPGGMHRSVNRIPGSSNISAPKVVTLPYSENTFLSVSLDIYARLVAKGFSCLFKSIEPSPFEHDRTQIVILLPFSLTKLYSY